MINKLSDFSIDVDEICQLEGPVHVYATNLKNNLLACNKTQSDFFREVFNLSKKDIIGSQLKEILNSKGESKVANVVYEENEAIIKNRSPKQFYNVWLAHGLYIVEFLTTKMPIYTSTCKIAGVLGFSYYINKFSILEAIKQGLTERETDCLFYLLEGKSTKEIASLLSLAVRTVETYLDNIKDKLGCFNKSQLVTKAVQTKLRENPIESLILLNKKMLNIEGLNVQEKIKNKLNCYSAKSILLSTTSSK